MVPGPNHSVAVMKDRIVGGWDYALKCVEFIARMNPLTNFEIVFGHAKEFGDIPELPYYKNIKFHTYVVSKLALGLKFPNQPSSQHGALLNFALKKHRLVTEFYAVIDPDCYLLQSNTFELLTNHMRSNGIDVIGISYPATFPKTYYWDFPTAYFQLMHSISCPPNKLNFLPDESSFIKDKLQQGGIGVPTPRVVKVLFKIPIFFREFAIKTYKKLLLGRGTITVFLGYLLRNLLYQGQPLFRDTGWDNRENLKELRTEVIPYLVLAKNLQTNFNSQNYLDNNNDVKVSGIDPAWHFYSNGVYETRVFGKQFFRYRLLIMLLNKRAIDRSIFPATSLITGASVFQSILSPVDWGGMRAAFEYHWRGKPFCIHLGHSAKSSQHIDMYRLDILLLHIMAEAGRSDH